MGVHFVGFVGQYGYDRVLSVLGRHVRDFLNGLDNLHEYLKFSYPRMRAPSFICENETRQGEWIFQASRPFFFTSLFPLSFFFCQEKREAEVFVRVWLRKYISYIEVSLNLNGYRKYSIHLRKYFLYYEIYSNTMNTDICGIFYI